MKTLVTTLSALAAVAALALLLPRGSSAPVPAAAARAAFLVRFGIDGKTDIDWSGSIAAPHSRLAPWQFDSERSAHRQRLEVRDAHRDLLGYAVRAQACGPPRTSTR